MKKIISLFLLTLCLLTSCTNSFHYDYEELKQNVISAEIIDFLKTSEEDLSTTITIIPENKMNDFLLDLSNIQIRDSYGSPASPKGLCLKLCFEQSYELINNSFIMEYNYFGNIINPRKNIVIKKATFDEMILKYTT